MSNAMSDLSFDEELAVGRYLEMKMWRAVEAHAALLKDDKTAAYAYVNANGAKSQMLEYAKRAIDHEQTAEQMKKQLKCKTEAGCVRKISRQRKEYWEMVRRVREGKNARHDVPLDDLF